MRRLHISQRGVSAVITAGSLLLLMGAAAIAVDVSGFYEQASSQRRAADLACLAGVAELPQNPTLAVSTAAEFVAPNHPRLADLPALPDGGSIAAGINLYTVGDHAVEIETPFNGSSTRMRVSILQSAGTTFARAIGANQVDILEYAVCEVGSGVAGGDMPWGMLTGFTGGIINYGQNQCTLNGNNNSQCSGLAIPRQNDPAGSQFVVTTANNYVANMVAGLNWGLGPGAGPDILCPMNGVPQPSDPNPCNRVATVSGDDPSKVYRGIISGFTGNNPPFPGANIGYLEPLHGNNASLSFGGDTYDGHDMPDILQCAGGCPTAVQSLGWTDSTAHPVVTVTRITECDCRRLARVPIVSNFPTNAGNCGNYDPNDPTQLNSCSARIVGFQWVWLLRPFFNGTVDANGDGIIDNDFANSGSGNQVKTIAAVAVDVSGATVDGDCFSDYKEGAPKKVRLIDG